MRAIWLAAVDGSSPPAKLTAITLTAKIGYSYQADHVTWSAQGGPVLNADSPDLLRETIKRA